MSKVEYMITPADVARMHANAAVHHTLNAADPLEPDELLYTSQSTGLPQGESLGNPIPTPAQLRERLAAAAHAKPAAPSPHEQADATPTPAMMPRRRTSDRPATFASLDAQELPVVREYSAGGLVFDDHGRVAIIARHSRSGHLEWCLPKGHIEKGETPQQTAVREVHEETGILG